ncbi:MAG: Riboflavin biosynthesis protein RibF [Alphaproteobacteria bacterium MarineAlpha9_Bin1]|nr:MAG: Riboflavin biosynthesis protein RibF [Alphaproteobacteria bacterium MarineAlpha9_Bin1]
MSKIKLYRDYREMKKKFPRTAVAIGNFDGLHLGHKGLLDYAKKLSIKNEALLLVFTFYPHPLRIIRPGNEPQKILSFRSKIRKMSELGVDIVLIQRFNNLFSKISAEDFVVKILLGYLNAVQIIVGEDFRFGYKRKGDTEYLNSGVLKNKAKLNIVEPIKGSGGKYSSSTVRDLINNGKMEMVKSILGEFYEVEGVVVKGKQLGKKLGFPTANINYLDCMAPQDGIYAGFVLHQGKYYGAALSSGTRPHFEGNERFLEAHILDFKEDIYGRRIRALFVKKIRDESVFEDNDKLKKQILMDCLEVKNILRKEGNLKINGDSYGL